MQPSLAGNRSSRRRTPIFWLGLPLMGILIAGQAAGEKARGPLRVHPTNPRYFTDGSGKAIYLTGAHTWANLQDMGDTDPPRAFDYSAHLDFLEKHHHNFIRLWRWEFPRWKDKYDKFTQFRYCAPHPWKRTGPGNAQDGKPRFDLEQLDQGYFDRLRARTIAAGERGIYVSIMLFEGWGLQFAPWDGHPFDLQNNVNRINGDPNGDGKGTETHTLQIAAISRIQEAYVRKVIDTVNDLDNVLYEIANESHKNSVEWQYHLIRLIHDYEKRKPKQHPVGMTTHGQMGNPVVFDSPAEWISPAHVLEWRNEKDPYKFDPPPQDGKKAILLDTDHIWGVGGGREWVWKSFLRGYNPVWMDPYDRSINFWEAVPANADEVRRNLGYTLRYAKKMNLATMRPRNDLASTTYCLANPGKEYLVYLPDGGEVTVDLSAASGALAVEWTHPVEGTVTSGGMAAGGGKRVFKAPFGGDAVLYMRVRQ